MTIATALIWKVLLSFTKVLPDYIINETGTFTFSLICTAFGSIGGVLGLIYN
ncbi:hypothetical protein [Chlorogloeopsis sp. ULAP02]|uniref:hypothetical protein n=1 Tax=Chlorogloeopsis sp. ULAP02 TaxID=3107926 RepID=UPI00313675F4